MSFKRIITLVLSATLALGVFALAGCNSNDGNNTQSDQASQQQAQQEQDNCYGDDLPAINTSNE